MGTHHDRWTRWGDRYDNAGQWAATVLFVLVAAAIVVGLFFYFFGI